MNPSSSTCTRSPVTYHRLPATSMNGSGPVVAQVAVEDRYGPRTSSSPVVLAGKGGVRLGIHDQDLDAVDRLSHRARPDVARPIARHHRRTLGNPIAFQNHRLGGQMCGAGEERLGAFFRAGDDDPQRIEVSALASATCSSGRWAWSPAAWHDRRAVVRTNPGALVGIGMVHHADAAQQRRNHAAQQAETVERRQTAQQAVGAARWETPPARPGRC